MEERYSEKGNNILAVLNAMAPNWRLRKFLETMTYITLARLMRFLQTHFEEGNSRDLRGKLASMSQLTEESTYHFVIRCLETRQKIIIACKQSDEITHDPNLAE